MKQINEIVLKNLIKIQEVKSKFLSFVFDEKGDAEFNDGGSSNWGRNIAIGFAIGAILFTLVKSFMPELVNAWKGKVMEWFI